MNAATTINSVLYFILAGLCEIGGGYLVWLWLREGKPFLYGLWGAIILVIYGVIPTLQPAHFGRVYAAYGGLFIVLSILWGWKVDHIAPSCQYNTTGRFAGLWGFLERIRLSGIFCNVYINLLKNS